LENAKKQGDLQEAEGVAKLKYRYGIGTDFDFVLDGGGTGRRDLDRPGVNCYTAKAR